MTTTIEITVTTTINGNNVTETLTPTSEEEIKEALLKEYRETRDPNEETEQDYNEDDVILFDFEVEDWGEAEDYGKLQDLEIIYQINENDISNDIDVINAAVCAGIDINDIDEAYNGCFKDDEEFVEDLLEQTGDVPKLPHYVYIDWERTARDVMQDYTEENGHYFRNL